MIEESGCVVAIDGDFAVVETQRRSSCDACSMNKSCGTGVISKVYSGRFSRTRALNNFGARVGDEVVVGLHEEALVRGSLAVYAVPLLLMLVLALVGDAVAKEFTFANSDGLSVLFGAFGLAVGFLWVKRFSRNVSNNEQYQPVILRRHFDGLSEVPIRFNG